MLTLLVVLAAQAGGGAITDTIAGTVTGPGGRPPAGAIVQATSTVTRLSRWQTSNAAGRFTIYFPGRAQYDVTAHYFGLVPAQGDGTLRPWARENARAASIRLELAGFANPIDTILRRSGLLGLTGDQITRLRDIAASTDSFTLPELERARSVLSASEWTRLSTELVPGAALRPPTGSTAPANSAPSAPSVPSAPLARPAPPAPPAARAASDSAQREVPVPKRPDVRLYTGVSTVYESNLTHTPTSLESYGVLLGVGGDFRGRWSHTTLALQYDGVFRRYTGTDIWNVPGHVASVAVAQRVTRRWGVGAEAGIQLNGSTEDRVLRNEYTAEANLEYRLTGAGRLQLYSVYMLKRYPDPLISHNAADPRVGLKYRRVLGASGTWGLGGRYDYNQADSSRHTYRGWTATTDVGFPMGSAGLISASVRYNIRRYPFRLVTVDTGQELRRDADFVATLALRQGIARVWDVVVSCRYEYYRSNDPTKTFRDDLVAVTLMRNW